MKNILIQNILTAEELLYIVNDPTVIENKAKTSTTSGVVNFSVPLPPTIVQKIETGLSLDLSQLSTIPMRWIVGDTKPHRDVGAAKFSDTYLIYVTDSADTLIVDNVDYPIAAGNAHIFSESLMHETRNADAIPRLLIGPMSETGIQVGGSINMLYYSSKDDALNENNYLHASYDTNYIVQTVGIISTWAIAKSTYYDNTNLITTIDTTNTPYSSGSSLPIVSNSIYYLYPYTPSFVRPARIYSDTTLVFYKPDTVSSSCGGNGVRNWRTKSRRT